MLRALVAAERTGEPVRGPRAVEAGKAEIPETGRGGREGQKTDHRHAASSDVAQIWLTKPCLAHVVGLQHRLCSSRVTCYTHSQMNSNALCIFSPVIMLAVLTAVLPLGRLADPATRDWSFTMGTEIKQT